MERVEAIFGKPFFVIIVETSELDTLKEELGFGSMNCATQLAKV